MGRGGDAELGRRGEAGFGFRPLSPSPRRPISVFPLRPFFLFLLLAAYPLQLTGRAQAPEPDVLRIDTDLVSLNVSVFNRKGAQLPASLQQKDFAVLDNGEPQEISFFAVRRFYHLSILLKSLFIMFPNRKGFHSHPFRWPSLLQQLGQNLENLPTSSKRRG